MVMSPLRSWIAIILLLLGGIATSLIASEIPTSSPAMSAAISASTQSAVGYDDADEASGGLLILLFIALIVAVVVLVMGLFVAAIAGGILAALVFLGVVSTSVLAGVKSRRFGTAARMFFVQIAAIGGAIVGCVVIWVAAWLVEVHWTAKAIFALGIVVGIVSGGAVGLALHTIWTRMQRRWIDRAAVQHRRRFDTRSTRSAQE